MGFSEGVEYRASGLSLEQPDGDVVASCSEDHRS